MTEAAVSVCPGRVACCTGVRRARSPVVATRAPPSTRRSQRPREDDVSVVVDREGANEAGPEGVPETPVVATVAPSVPQQQQQQPQQPRRVRKQATRIAHRLRQQRERRDAQGFPRVAEVGFAERLPTGDTSRTTGFTWVLSSLAGAFVTVSVLIGVVGFFVVNMPPDEHRLETVGGAEGGGTQTSESSWPVASAANKDGGRTSVVCYWNSSSLLRSAPKDYDLGKLCAHCCTHLVYMGAQLNADGRQLQFAEDDTGEDCGDSAVIRVTTAHIVAGLKSVRDMDALKTSHPQLKLVLSIRLEGSGVNNLSVGAEAPSRRAQLAELLVHWLSEFNFDGVEIDWDRLPVDLKPVYVDLVRVEACEAFLGELRSRQRVALALPLFGYAYRLRNSARYELRAAVRGPAPPGPYTDERGLLAYFEICLEFSSDLWVSLYDKEADCKIAVNRDKGQWIGYDNKATILNKVLFAKRMRMGGIAVVTVDMDDYNGDCGQRNVLLGQLHNALNELDRPIRRLPANLSLPPPPATTARAELYQTDHGRQARTTRPDGRRQA
ncbi:hypothetical protein HPB51_007906 [Rhipicephalus microplus]|uniref:GH18 domain-containing protein n=1 Tax=Rhipicephalus microplus TaxID=6941 RepID=A0A9J6EMS9_RHIMP|nr:hypothetical protein HPB51_007906 [Rhipicephalus microplus]